MRPAKSISPSSSDSDLSILAGPPPRGVNLRWIIVITARITITVSSMTIIETSSLHIYHFVVFAISLFWIFGAGYFVVKFFIWNLGFHPFSRLSFKLFSGWIEFVEYIYVHISHLFPFFPSGIWRAPPRSPSNIPDSRTWCTVVNLICNKVVIMFVLHTEHPCLPLQKTTSGILWGHSINQRL